MIFVMCVRLVSFKVGLIGDFRMISLVLGCSVCLKVCGFV